MGGGRAAQHRTRRFGQGLVGSMCSGEIKVREFVFEGPPGLEWRKAFKQ